jgi:hypothetical protein
MAEELVAGKPLTVIDRHVHVARAKNLSSAFRWGAHAQARVSSTADRRRKNGIAI